MEPTAVAAQFAPLVSAFPDWHWDVRSMVIDEDLIALHFSVTGTHRGRFQGIAATASGLRPTPRSTRRAGR